MVPLTISNELFWSNKVGSQPMPSIQCSSCLIWTFQATFNLFFVITPFQLWVRGGMGCSPQRLDLKMFRQASGGCASARQIHHGSVGIQWPLAARRSIHGNWCMQCIVVFHYQDLFKNLFWSFKYFLHPESFLQNCLEQEIEEKFNF